MVGFTKLATAGLLATSALAAPHGHHHSHTKRSTSKRGAAYNDVALIEPVAHAVSWAYDWNMLAMGLVPNGVEFVPMLWGSKMFGGWASAIQTTLASGSKYILGFNEPDNPAQAGMAPSDAVHAYKEYITPYAGKATLISPSTTNSNNPSEGLDWMKQFMDGCSDCNIGGLSVHWYGESADDLKKFVSQAVDLGNQYGIDQVWLTEFTLNSAINGGNPDEAATFLQDVLPWLDSQPNVARYAYFMCAEGYLLSGGSLSPSGQVYTS